jgi:hypothetical protein
MYIQNIKEKKVADSTRTHLCKELVYNAIMYTCTIAGRSSRLHNQISI